MRVACSLALGRRLRGTGDRSAVKRTSSRAGEREEGPEHELEERERKPLLTRNLRYRRVCTGKQT
jgi:hypothetical protein